MKTLFQRLYADNRGEDLIEYALLVAFVSLATVVAFQVMGTTMGNAYQSWDNAQQNRWDLNADLTPTSTP